MSPCPIFPLGIIQHGMTFLLARCPTDCRHFAVSEICSRFSADRLRDTSPTAPGSSDRTSNSPKDATSMTDRIELSGRHFDYASDAAQASFSNLQRSQGLNLDDASGTGATLDKAERSAKPERTNSTTVTHASEQLKDRKCLFRTELLQLAICCDDPPRSAGPRLRHKEPRDSTKRRLRSCPASLSLM